MSKATEAHITLAEAVAKSKSLYPRYFVTPANRGVSINAMARALKVCRAQPETEFRGWGWFEVPGRVVVRDFMAGLHDRINRRAAGAGL